MGDSIINLGNDLENDDDNSEAYDRGYLDEIIDDEEERRIEDEEDHQTRKRRS